MAGTYDTIGGTPRHDPEMDRLELCDICDKMTEDCKCPPCPKCGVIGDMKCARKCRPPRIRWSATVPDGKYSSISSKRYKTRAGALAWIKKRGGVGIIERMRRAYPPEVPFAGWMIEEKEEIGGGHEN